MSPVRRAAAPRGVLYRIGHLPDPLALPPIELTGGGRFDDPEREYRVLYAGRRRACFLETLAPFRLSIEALAALQAVTGTDEHLPSALIPADWYQKRAVSRLRLMPGQRWLDLRATQTHEALRAELAPTLANLGVDDLDLAEVLGRERRLTQAISRWAYDSGYSGIVYRSRFTAASSLWAVFERARLEPVGEPAPILLDDPDMRAVAPVRSRHLSSCRIRGVGWPGATLLHDLKLRNIEVERDDGGPNDIASILVSGSSDSTSMDSL